jgi:uncharacterized protein with HEPN domain
VALKSSQRPAGHFSDELKGRHPEIPWSKVAGIGKVLRHEYERVAYDVLWRVVRDDLPPLENVCRGELAKEQAAEPGGNPPA